MSIKDTLAKLKAANSKGGNNIPMFKPAEGKNELVIVAAQGEKNPFMQWTVIAGLKPVAFHTISSQSNFVDSEGEPLVDPIEEFHAELKTDFNANLPIIKHLQINQQTVIAVLDLKNIEKGIQYWRAPKALTDEVVKFFENLEEDEDEEGKGEFWNIDGTNFQKIIVEYSKNAIPASKKYSVSLKTLNAKIIDTFKERYKELVPSLKPITAVMAGSTVSMDESKRLLEAFKVRIAEGEFDKVDEDTDEDSDGTVDLKKKESNKSNSSAAPKKRQWEEDDNEDE